MRQRFRNVREFLLYHVLKSERAAQKRARAARQRVVPPALRYTVLARDGYRCRACGARAADVELEVDHIRSVFDGGLTVLENLRALCIRCNQGKGSLSE